MDGRNRFHQQQRVPVHPAAALMEQRIIAQHREIQSLLLDNQRLAATHVALKQELSASTHELRHISAAATKLKAERDAQVRDVFERSLKMESEARMVVGVNEELIRVRGDMQKLNAERMELSADLGAVRADLARLRGDVHKLPLVKAEVEDLRRQIEIGRAAIELENKTREENLEQEEEMEKNMVIMARELKKLRAELANAKKRARAGTGYTGNYGNPEMSYGENTYVDTYGTRQVQGSADGYEYGSAAVSHAPYDRTRVHR